MELDRDGDTKVEDAALFLDCNFNIAAVSYAYNLYITGYYLREND